MNENRVISDAQPRDKPLVLVVDDHVFLAEVTCQALLQAGFAAESADSAASALDRINEMMPHALLLDVNLSEGSGLSFLKKLNAKHPALRVILWTCDEVTETEVRNAVDKGAYDFISKETEWSKVTALIRKSIKV